MMAIDVFRLRKPCMHARAVKSLKMIVIMSGLAVDPLIQVMGRLKFENGKQESQGGFLVVLQDLH